MAFDTLSSNANAQIYIAIEYAGDIYVYSDTRKLIEENKKYQSKNPPLPVLKSEYPRLLYRLLAERYRRPKQKCVFQFLQHKCYRERKSNQKIKALGMTLPEEPILFLLTSRDDLMRI